MILDRERFIALVDNDAPRLADAIVLLEGDGDARIDTCVQLLRRGLAPVVVVSGGVDDAERGCLRAEVLRDLLLAKGVFPGEILLDNRSRHTREQATEIMAMASRLGWKGIHLVASNFHQYRAFLTFLQAMREAGLDLLIYNIPARDLPWFKETGWGRRIDLLDSEFEKIDAYGAMGHVATYREAIEYMRLKECKA